MPVLRPGQIVSLILGGELLAFLLLWLTGTLERLGPALVAAIMVGNLIILALVVVTILRRRKP